jgi:CheY-like chemotaxis protein/streptogramin lyase
LENGLPEDSWDAIGMTPDGSVWIRSPSRLYRKPPGASRLVQEKPDIASSYSWGALTTVRDGSVMVPTDQGLAIGSGGRWSVVDDRRGLRSAMTSAVLEDRQGSLWIALVGAGVARWLGYGEWEGWTKAQGLPSNLIWSIRRDRKGALWVGTSLGVARLDASGPPRTWTRKDGLGGDNVRWLGDTSDGAVWAVMKPGGLARIDPATGKIRHVGAAEGLACGTVHRGFIDHLDRLWLATACGVFRNDRPAASDRFLLIDQPASLTHAAWAVTEDRQGTMWITEPAGLWRLRGGGWHRYGKAEGLDGALWLRHRYDAGIERVEFSGDRIVACHRRGSGRCQVAGGYGPSRFRRVRTPVAGQREWSVGARWRLLDLHEHGRWPDLARLRRRSLLGRCGWRRLDWNQLARDGSEAIAAVERNRYDLVLMDVQMPVVDGVTATLEIRSRVPADRQPVIYGLTAHATTEYRDICLRAGMNGYLTKPLVPEKLRELIAELSARPVPPELAGSDSRAGELFTPSAVRE